CCSPRWNGLSALIVGDGLTTPVWLQRRPISPLSVARSLLEFVYRRARWNYQLEFAIRKGQVHPQLLKRYQDLKFIQWSLDRNRLWKAYLAELFQRSIRSLGLNRAVSVIDIY